MGRRENTVQMERHFCCVLSLDPLHAEGHGSALRLLHLSGWALSGILAGAAPALVPSISDRCLKL